MYRPSGYVLGNTGEQVFCAIVVQFLCNLAQLESYID